MELLKKEQNFKKDGQFYARKLWITAELVEKALLTSNQGTIGDTWTYSI